MWAPQRYRSSIGKRHRQMSKSVHLLIGASADVVLLIYCSYSCGYRKAFEEYASILSDKYPQILINGANYDPPGVNFYLSKLILAAKMIFILVIVSSYDIWGALGQAVPRWYTWCSENKIYACMMVFFVGNMLESQVQKAGRAVEAACASFD